MRAKKGKTGKTEKHLANPVVSSIKVDGLGLGLPGGFLVESAPPDTTGAVGDTQFVQWVNTSFAVYSKDDFIWDKADLLVPAQTSK